MLRQSGWLVQTSAFSSCTSLIASSTPSQSVLVLLRDLRENAVLVLERPEETCDCRLFFRTGRG